VLQSKSQCTQEPFYAFKEFYHHYNSQFVLLLMTHSIDISIDILSIHVSTINAYTQIRFDTFLYTSLGSHGWGASTRDHLNWCGLSGNYKLYSITYANGDTIKPTKLQHISFIKPISFLLSVSYIFPNIQGQTPLRPAPLRLALSVDYSCHINSSAVFL